MKKEFGGSLLVGKRKSKRPLDILKPIHLVLKAKDSTQLLRHKRTIKNTLLKYCRRFKIPLQEFGVHADHIHIAISLQNREQYTSWVRAITSVLVQRIPGLKWRLRPYTRVAQWGKQWRILRRYILRNKIQGEFILAAHQQVEAWVRNFLHSQPQS